jgi:hypothetical protein
MLIHVVPSHALSAWGNHTTYGARGGAPPATHFDSAGYNDAVYGWKNGTYHDHSGETYNGQNRCGSSNWYLRYGSGSQWDQTPCRRHDTYYNEWSDLDDSSASWNTTEPVDPSGVDSWLSNVGGGMYKARPTQLLRLFAR